MAPRTKLTVQADQAFGRLTVVREERLPLTPGRAAHGFKTGLRGALCRCECGTEIVVSLVNLHNGSAQSCGCRRIEVSSARTPGMSEANVTHGLSDHPLYQTWLGMMQRCANPRHRHYPDYGGRGISVTSDWHAPEAFIGYVEATLGNRPQGSTLDRINNDGNYQPGNIRWASHTAQASNRRPLATKKLSEEARREMTAKRAAGAILADLAGEYGVSIATAHRYTKDYRTEHRERSDDPRP